MDEAIGIMVGGNGTSSLIYCFLSPGLSVAVLAVSIVYGTWRFNVIFMGSSIIKTKILAEIGSV